MYKSLKMSLDPNNIFAVNNTIYEDEEEKTEDFKNKFKWVVFDTITDQIFWKDIM